MRFLRKKCFGWMNGYFFSPETKKVQFGYRWHDQRWKFSKSFRWQQGKRYGTHSLSTEQRIFLLLIINSVLRITEMPSKAIYFYLKISLEGKPRNCNRTMHWFKLPIEKHLILRRVKGLQALNLHQNPIGNLREVFERELYIQSGQFSIIQE